MKPSQSSYFSLPRAILGGVLTLLGSLIILLLLWKGEFVLSPQDESKLILLDHSLSMAVEDMKITGVPASLSRLDFAKTLIKKHISAGTAIAMITYAKNPTLLFPISSDSSDHMKLIESVEVEHQVGGSDLPVALTFAKNLYGEKNLSILVFTDGGNTSTSESPNIPRNWRITFYGIGSEAGGKIPLGYNANSERMYKYYSGSEVIVPYEGSSLREMARQASAQYIHESGASGFHDVVFFSFFVKNWLFIIALSLIIVGILLHPYARKKRHI